MSLDMSVFSPNGWSIPPTPTQICKVTLDRSSREFIKYANKFYFKYDGLPVYPDKIIKVLNPFVYGRFVMRQLEYQARRGPNSFSTMELFHATGRHKVTSILEKNLDWRMVKRGKFGKGLPNDLSVYWHQYPYSLGVGFCKFRALFSETSSYVSVLTIVAFSMERYLAICHPLHSYTMAGLKRAVRIIAVLWIVALISASPFAMFTTINYLTYPPNTTEIAPESAFCAVLYLPEGWHLYEASGLLFFLAPMLVIMVLYIRMGLRIRHTKRHSLGKNLRGSVHGESRQAQRRKPIIRMLAAVVIAFFLCWMPFHAQRVFYIHGKNWHYFKEINEWLFSVAGWLYYISSTVNPILYNIMSNRYRIAFRETLCGEGRSRKGASASTGLSCREHSNASGYGESTHLMRVRSCARRYRPSIWRRNKDIRVIGEDTDPIASNAVPKGVLLELTATHNGRPNCCTTVSNCSESPEVARRRETFI